MAVLAAEFLENYPEFSPLYVENEPLVDAVLLRADRRISVSWPEDVRDDLIMLQAADMLVRTPMGRNAMLSRPGETTAYHDDLQTRKRGFACGRSRVV